MMHTSGRFYQRTLLNEYLNKNAGIIREIIFLISLGALAVLIHATVKIPMHLPGKQGVLWIAILVSGRYLSKTNAAGTVTGAGAAICSFGLGADAPLTWFIYLLTGNLIDIVYTYASDIKNKFWLIIIACGILHALKPLLRYAVNIVVPLPLESLTFSFMYPVTTHFIFGMIGAGLGIMVVKGIDYKKSH